MGKVDFRLAWSNEAYEHYSYGHCMHLAAALHRLLGWGIQACVMECAPPEKSYIDHAWVVDPTGAFCLDSDGFYSIERNGFIGGSSTLHPSLSEKELQKLTLEGCTRPFSDEEWSESVAQAMRIASEFFPLSDLASVSASKQNPVSQTSVELADVTLALPRFYHGTTRRQWRAKHDGKTYLNLTSSLNDAERYANEWAESETEDYGDCQPIVMVIEPDVLRRLLSKNVVELQPDWGWVEAQEHDAAKNGGSFKEGDDTWQNSLSSCGCIGIGGFEDKLKKLFRNSIDIDASPTP